MVQANDKIGAYTLLSKLGRGAFGVVWLAEKRTRYTTTKFALKLPNEEEIDAEAVKHEAAVWEQASGHPNVLPIIEADDYDGQLVIVSEYAPGGSLAKWLKQHHGQAPSIEAAVEMTIGILAGLEHLHSRNIIHRDLKPDNILLQGTTPRLADFGIARLLKTTVQSTMASGTPAYMAPEAFDGVRTKQTDLWAVGVILYQLLTGRLPFSQPDMASLLKAIITHEPHPLPSSIPAALRQVSQKALHKDPAQRYASAAEMSRALRALEPSLATTIGTQETIRHLEPTARDLPAELHRESLMSHGAATTQAPQGQKNSTVPRRRRVALVAAPLLLLLIAGIAYLYFSRPGKVAINSLAVLPLMNISNDSELDYLADGVTESLTNRLSQLPNMKVIARNSVFRYKGQKIDPQTVARELGVLALLIGNIVQRGDMLLISLELVDTQDNSLLWGKRFERKAAEILAVQEEIAREVVEKLRLPLTGETQGLLAKQDTQSIAAYQAYLRGRYFWNKRTGAGFKQAIEFFNQAIEIDPAYALAHAGLADSYLLLGTYNLLPPNEALPKAKKAAERAIEIDRTLVEAHTSLARIKADYDWNWSEAEREFQFAMEQNPNYATAHHWYALHLMAMGQQEKALAEVRLAQQLDPLSLSISASVGLSYYWARRYDQAIEQFRKTLELDPNFGLAHVLLGQAYEQKGMSEAAIAELQKAHQLDDSTQVLAILGHAYAVSGRKQEAQEIIDKLQQLSQQTYVSPYFSAIIYAGLGERERALEWLEKAYEDRSGWLVWLKVEPRLDGLRADQRFTSLLQRTGHLR